MNDYSLNTNTKTVDVRWSCFTNILTSSRSTLVVFLYYLLAIYLWIDTI